MRNEQGNKSRSKLIVIAIAFVFLLIVVLIAIRALFTTSLGEDEHSDSWLMLGYDAARSNYNYAAELKLSLKQKEVLKLDLASVSEDMRTTMFAADKTNVYTISYPKSTKDKEEKSKIKAFDVKTGKERWEFSGPMLGAGALDNNHLYCVSAKPNKVYALDVSTGKKSWESQLVKKATGLQSYIPVVRNGIVYVVSEKAELISLDAKTGKKRWAYSETQIVGSPAVSRGIVYCLTEDRRVLALDAKSGEQRWVVGAPNWEMLLNPSVGNGQVCIVDRNSDEATDSLIALDARSGALQWQFKMGKNKIVNSMCLGEDKIILSITEFAKVKPESKSQGEIMAINAKNGKKLWRKEVWGMPASLIGAGNTCYVSSSRIWRAVSGDIEAEGGSVFAVSMENGKVVEEYKVVTKKQDEQNKYLQPQILISNENLFAQNVAENTLHIFAE